MSTYANFARHVFQLPRVICQSIHRNTHGVGADTHKTKTIREDTTLSEEAYGIYTQCRGTHKHTVLGTHTVSVQTHTYIIRADTHTVSGQARTHTHNYITKKIHTTQLRQKTDKLLTHQTGMYIQSTQILCNALRIV